MLSLYSALLAQHSRQLTPVRCAEPTIVQLHRYFEDVVLENNLAALVVESLLPEAQRSLRDVSRVREVGASHATPSSSRRPRTLSALSSSPTARRSASRYF